MPILPSAGKEVSTANRGKSGRNQKLCVNSGHEDLQVNVDGDGIAARSGETRSSPPR